MNGVFLSGMSVVDKMDPLTADTTLGQMIGKRVGVFTLKVLPIKLGLPRMPHGAKCLQITASLVWPGAVSPCRLSSAG